ncbi:unnamed protein product [Zymoseptoria tritici ST99CH_3D7]|uniref:Uncharacterized protein n=1 Tax=Zymoseptoria tritici (strain ST99CH_3D7) TaxID=1276538 RepID=A0A1X7RL90_ZYMT9|nr:unnamed protein product [Zymoseptoria tritici ST99CH_3D7]
MGFARRGSNPLLFRNIFFDNLFGVPILFPVLPVVLAHWSSLPQRKQVFRTSPTLVPRFCARCAHFLASFDDQAELLEGFPLDETMFTALVVK